jgi:hypothetical protein
VPSITLIKNLSVYKKGRNMEKKEDIIIASHRT